MMDLRNEAATPLIKEDNTLTRRRNLQQTAGSSSNNQHNGSRNDDTLGPSSNPNFEFPNKPNTFHIFLILAAYLASGTLCFYLVRTQINGKKTNGIVDALYFCIVTMTTLGYGDLTPNTALSKLLACLFVFVGMAIVAMLLSRLADYLVEKQELALAKALHLQEKLGTAEILEEAATKKTKYKFFLCLAFLMSSMVCGMVVLVLVEKMSLVNAFYCVCATMTTLGYGDESFSTEGGRIFAVFWILSGTVCLAQLFFYLTEIYTESRQRNLLKWVLGRKMTRIDIEAADLDNDNVLSAAEFILYKLKEMEKIEDEDIAALMEYFKTHDVDHSGTLTAIDVNST